MPKNLDSLFYAKLTRRQFLLRSAAAFAAMNLSSNLLGESHAEGSSFKTKNIILVIFGSPRNTETISDPQHKYIPNLWNKLKPQGSLYTNVYNEGKLIHTTAGVSMLTGNWEYKNFGKEINWRYNFPNPTIFEYFRRSQDIGIEKTWSFSTLSDVVPMIANTFDNERGPAGWLMQLSRPVLQNDLSEEIALVASRIRQERSIKERIKIFKEVTNLLKNKVPPDEILPPVSQEIARFNKDFYLDWLKNPNNNYGHDNYICGAAIAAMKLFQPRLIVVSFGEIDVAHSGNWSRYTEAIKKTDELTFKLWDAMQQNEYYKDKTTMLVIPEHGREGETPDGPGFVSHGGLYDDARIDEACKHVWLLAIGPDIHKNKIFQERKEHIDIAPTIGTLLDFHTPYAKGKAITEMLSDGSHI